MLLDEHRYVGVGFSHSIDGDGIFDLGGDIIAIDNRDLDPHAGLRLESNCTGGAARQRRCEGRPRRRSARQARALADQARRA